MTLHFKNYDNGWKYVKMGGAIIFVVFFFRVLQYASYAKSYRMELLEIMAGNEYELVLLFLGLVAYFIGKWENYICELKGILGVRKYAQINVCLDEKKQSVYQMLAESGEQEAFVKNYELLNNRLKQALYLKEIEWNKNKPEWIS